MPEIDLFAVQPLVDASTYRSEARFRDAMARLVARCDALRARDERHRPSAPALAVFPEHVGTFLALAPLGAIGRFVPTTSLATALALLKRPGGFVRGLRAGGPASAAALRALADDVRGAYERTFSDLARATGMTIVAGSVLLPDPPESSDVYNISFMFDTDGRIVGRWRKVHLVPEIEDTLGLCEGDATDLAPVSTPVGPVGTLVCYDGFAVPHTTREPGWKPVGDELARKGAKIIAQPSANPWRWDEGWVHAKPGDRLLRRDQWHCEGMMAQLASLDGVGYAVTSHLVGRVMDQAFEGQSEILARDAGGEVSIVARAARADVEDVVHARVPAPWLES